MMVMVMVMMTMRSLFFRQLAVQLLMKTMEQLFVPEGNSVSAYRLKIYTDTCIKVYYNLIYVFISPHQHRLNAP